MKGAVAVPLYVLDKSTPTFSPEVQANIVNVTIGPSKEPSGPEATVLKELFGANPPQPYSWSMLESAAEGLIVGEPCSTIICPGVAFTPEFTQQVTDLGERVSA